MLISNNILSHGFVTSLFCATTFSLFSNLAIVVLYMLHLALYGLSNSFYRLSEAAENVGEEGKQLAKFAKSLL